MSDPKDFSPKEWIDCPYCHKSFSFKRRYPRSDYYMVRCPHCEWDFKIYIWRCKTRPKDAEYL